MNRLLSTLLLIAAVSLPASDGQAFTLQTQARVNIVESAHVYLDAQPVRQSPLPVTAAHAISAAVVEPELPAGMAVSVRGPADRVFDLQIGKAEGSAPTWNSPANLAARAALAVGVAGDLALTLPSLETVYADRSDPLGARFAVAAPADLDNYEPPPELVVISVVFE